MSSQSLISHQFNTSVTLQQYNSISNYALTYADSQPRWKIRPKRQFQKQGCYCLETERHIPPTYLCSTERFVSSIHPERANPQIKEMKHSASGLDPQHSWAKVHPLCHGPISKQLLLPQGRGKVGLRQLHHTLTYLLHQQDRQDRAQEG